MTKVDQLMHAQSPKRKGYLHLTIAALTCPCHVPIYLAIFGGTALGALLQENLLVVILSLSGIFLVALLRGVKLFKGRGG
jgi:mercuric ion transport protein